MRSKTGSDTCQDLAKVGWQQGSDSTNADGMSSVRLMSWWAHCYRTLKPLDPASESLPSLRVINTHTILVVFTKSVVQLEPVSIHSILMPLPSPNRSAWGVRRRDFRKRYQSSLFYLARRACRLLSMRQGAPSPHHPLLRYHHVVVLVK